MNDSSSPSVFLSHHDQQMHWPAGVTLSKAMDQSIPVHRIRNMEAEDLVTKFNIDIYLPPDYDASGKTRFPVLFFNDGQDMQSVKLTTTLVRLYAIRQLPSIIVVALHAGERLQEYGVAAQADYRNRGSKAGAYTRFITEKLLPLIRRNYLVLTAPQHVAFAGFSLGGLSALDIVWHHPYLFGLAGVFSGALWWRNIPYDEENPDAGRIIHHLISRSECKPGLRFWFQAGTLDETDDRNGNGVIDAIDDTLDLIEILKKMGYRHKRDIQYREVKDGHHHPTTWAQVLPEFLVWAFGNQ